MAQSFTLTTTGANFTTATAWKKVELPGRGSEPGGNKSPQLAFTYVTMDAAGSGTLAAALVENGTTVKQYFTGTLTSTGRQDNAANNSGSYVGKIVWDNEFASHKIDLGGASGGWDWYIGVPIALTTATQVAVTVQWTSVV